MALGQTFYNLKNLRATMISGKSLNIVSLQIKRNPIYAPKFPGQAVVSSQVFMGENPPDITAEIYNDDQVAFGDIAPNTPLDSFTLLSPNDADMSFLQSDFFTKFPVNKMVFGSIDTTLDGSTVSTLKVPILCNVLNPTADGGFPSP